MNLKAETRKQAGDHLWDNGDLTGAESCYQEALLQEPNLFGALNNLAMLFEIRGETADAIRLYKAAILASPLQPTVHTNLASLLAARGLGAAAIRHHRSAVRLPKCELMDWQAFVVTLSQVRVLERDEILIRDVLQMFQQPGLDYQKLGRLTIDLLRSRDGELDLSSPLAVALLLKTINVDCDFELRAKAWRASFNQRCLDSEVGIADLATLSALAVQNFICEGLYVALPEEQPFLNRLDLMHANPSGCLQKELVVAALRASFRTDVDAFEEFRARLSMHLDLFIEPTRAFFSAILPHLEALPVVAVRSVATIQELDGLELKARFESDPYPRWIHLPKIESRRAASVFSEIFPAAKVEGLESAPQILIAGCGTGRQAIHSAMLYEDCKVTAIDLSLKSVQYGAAMARRLGVMNIEFIHTDLRNVAMLEKHFDVIESVGVIHHLEDSLEALKSLKEVLKPGGWLRLGLYSRAARTPADQVKALLEAWRPDYWKGDAIESRNHLLSCHRQSLPASILSSHDFNTLSGFKDLLFDRTEYKYSIDELKTLLAEAKLEFIGFEPIRDQRQGQTRPVTLEEGRAAEALDPLTFAGMYQFWARG